MTDELAPESSSAGAKPAPREAQGDTLKENLRTILFAVGAALIFRVLLFEPFHIEGASMEPTLLDGDHVLVARYPYGVFLPGMSEAIVNWGSPDRGDIIILLSPYDEEVIVKRVIGVAGDSIRIDEDGIYRNDELVEEADEGPCQPAFQRAVHEEPDCHVYRTTNGEATHLISREEGTVSRRTAGPLVVPEGHIYVLGDHRSQSQDSRVIGPIPVERVKGRVLFIYLSASDTGDWRWDRVFDSVD